ncbi:MAG: hypothetical protein PHY47_20570 [Lachnospiraceae bacterium]|jgi:hypothetical protein|nr:hypothetical protein [Lachnospiraceae bacterium]
MPKHIHYDFYPMGLNGSLNGGEANEIIEEIIQLLISKKLTVIVAKQILEDTKEALEKETLIGKRYIDNKIT